MFIFYSKLHILKQFFRTKTCFPSQRKSISVTNNVLMMSSHGPLFCLPEQPCQNLLVPEEVGILQHYRNTCTFNISQEDCHKMKQHWKEDKSLWRYKDQVIPNVFKAMQGLE